MKLPKHKNLTFAHVRKNGGISLFYEIKGHSGKSIGYDEIILEDTIDIRIEGSSNEAIKSFNFSHLTFHSEIVGILKHLERITIYVNNNSQNTIDLGASRNSIILWCKDFRVSVDDLRLNGKALGNYEVAICGKG